MKTSNPDRAILVQENAMTSFGKGLVEAAHQAVAIAEGRADPETYRVHASPLVDIKAIRRALDLTQTQFAHRFGFPIGTLRDLEQGRAQPDSSTRAYLLVISREPALVQRVLESA
jgi:putative transcriptional regulator